MSHQQRLVPPQYNFKNQLKNMIKNVTHHIKLLEHTTFWLFIYLFVFDYHFLENNWLEAIGRTFEEIITYAVIIYLNLLVLIPIFLKKNRLGLYLFSLLATVLVYIFCIKWTGLEQHFYEHTGWRNVFSMVLNTSLFLLISFLYWYFKQWHIEREQNFIIKTEKLEAELNFLRAQISPHFVFNTLNNIYTLAIQKHDNTAPMVAKLSALLRHILYESDKGQILLKKEMDTLKQYIELHLLRKPRSQNVDFYSEGNMNTWKIAPMLLISLVENAFKHSQIDQNENAWIKINSEISDDGELVFSTENIAFPIIQSEVSGIGLQNMRRQLAIDYPNKHTLNIKNEHGIFYVNLVIQLKN